MKTLKISAMLMAALMLLCGCTYLDYDEYDDAEDKEDGEDA